MIRLSNQQSPLNAPQSSESFEQEYKKAFESLNFQQVALNRFDRPPTIGSLFCRKCFKELILEDWIIKHYPVNALSRGNLGKSWASYARRWVNPRLTVSAISVLGVADNKTMVGWSAHKVWNLFILCQFFHLDRYVVEKFLSPKFAWSRYRVEAPESLMQATLTFTPVRFARATWSNLIHPQLSTSSYAW